MSTTLKAITIDLLIYLASFLAVFYLNYGNIEFSDRYTSFLIIYIISWGISSLLTRKFVYKAEFSVSAGFRPYLTAFFLMVGILSGILLSFELIDVSRLVVLGSLLLSLAFETIYFRLRSKIPAFKGDQFKLIITPKLFGVDFVLLSWVLIFVLVKDIGVQNLNNYHYLLLTGIYICWFGSAMFFHQYYFSTKINYFRLFWSYLKSYLILFALVLFILLMLRISKPVGIQVVFSTILYAFWSGIILTFYYLIKKPAASDEIKTKLIKATEISDRDELGKISLPQKGKYKLAKPSCTYQTFPEKLENIYLKKFPSVFKFIQRNLDIHSIESNRAVVLRSSDIYNIKVLPENTLQLYMNLHEMNDIRRLNAYYIEVNKRLLNGGVFISKYEPIKNRHQRFLKKYPYFIAQAFYLMDFLWRRVTPKLLYIQKIYFGLTKGRNRAISLAEGLGRLYFCGFEIIDLFELDNFVYFVAKKNKPPLEDLNPSYGPFFKMRRVGINGKQIFVYKLRTMHPYSEYLQEFMFDNIGSKTGDKLDYDFRVTSWGRFFRAVWLDEIPMLLNLLKGDLKLVGVRPLSIHKFKMYDEDLQKFRVKSKPGLVPPYYKDMPKDFKGLQESEKKYLTEYEKHPILTDTKYFFGAWYNILFNKAHSA